MQRQPQTTFPDGSGGNQTLLAGLLGGRTSSRCSSQHLAIRLAFKLSAVCRCPMPLDSSVGRPENQVRWAIALLEIKGLKWDNLFLPTALSTHKSLLLQGAVLRITGQMLSCRRGVKAGLISLNTCSTLGANLGTLREREKPELQCLFIPHSNKENWDNCKLSQPVIRQHPEQHYGRMDLAIVV